MTLLVLKEMKVAPFGLVVRELDVLLGAGFQKMMLGDGDLGPPAVLAHRAERFRSQQEGSQRSMESVGEYAEKFRKQREGLRRSMVSLEGEEAQRSGGTVSLLFLVGVQTLRGLLIGRWVVGTRHGGRDAGKVVQIGLAWERRTRFGRERQRAAWESWCWC